MNNEYDDIMRSAMAENTRIAYAKGWQKFARFCEGKKRAPLPASPQLVVEFLAEQMTRPRRAGGRPVAMGTAMIYRGAINHYHVREGLTSPTAAPAVVAAVRGLARLHGAPPRQVMALRERHLQAMLARCPAARIGARDAAILALGFSAALRRSEICGLRVDDLHFVEEEGAPPRMFVVVRKSKTDQNGRGQKIAVMEGRRIKPVSRLQGWLARANITSGHVFRAMRRGGLVCATPLHPTDIPRIVKSYAAKIGLDKKQVAGHSLRAGFVTSAAAHNARLDKIMEITRHRNPATVLKYIRDSEVFNDHAGKNFL